MKIRVNLSFIKPALLACAVIIGLSACSSLGIETDPTYKNYEKEKLYKNGSLVDGEGGFSLFSTKDSANAEGAALGVNAYLWRATLDTLSFMPLASADPFGGTIITEWHTLPETPTERMKINVLILDRALRADGVRVSAFRQIQNEQGQWIDAPTASSTAMQLEDTILTRARQMRLAQKAK